MEILLGRFPEPERLRTLLFEERDPGDLLEIVVFGRDPEEAADARSILRDLLRRPARRRGFRQRVERTREQARLLTRRDPRLPAVARELPGADSRRVRVRFDGEEVAGPAADVSKEQGRQSGHSFERDHRVIIFESRRPKWTFRPRPV